MKKILLSMVGTLAIFSVVGCKKKTTIKTLPKYRTEFSTTDTYEYTGKGVLVSQIEHISYSSRNVDRKIDIIYNEDKQKMFEYNYSLNTDTLEWQYYKSTEYKYDDEGHAIRIAYETMTYDMDGKAVPSYSAVEYAYQDGLLIRETEKEGIDQVVTSYTYDSNNNRISGKTRGPRAYADSTYTYDENNNLIEETYLRSGNSGASWSSGSKYEYTYDSNKNVLAEIVYSLDYEDKSWKLSTKYEYTYDSNNNETSETLNYYRNNTWEVDNKREFTFDANNNKKTMAQYYVKNGNLEKSYEVEYSYDDKNNILKTIDHDSEGNVTYTTKYTYNENGDLIAEVGDGAFERSDIEYRYSYYK